MTTAADVLAGRADWSCECADLLAWLPTLPDDSIDLLFTSPPYRKARTYGIAAGRNTEDWVAWMVEVVKAAAPKVKGLIAINCDGQTEDYQYHPTPHLLIADLHRAGFNHRRPAYFHRVGIPGSGGPDWLRGDVEPVVCVTRPGKLPWSDNTACGHPPKWAPGGEMSNRLADGARVNQWGTYGRSGNNRTKTGKRQKTGRPSHITLTVGPQDNDTPSLFDAGPPVVKPPPDSFNGRTNRPGRKPDGKPMTKAVTRRKANGKRGEPGENGETQDGIYSPPVLANPGNVVQQTYTADEVAALLAQASKMVHCKVGGGQMGAAHAHDNEAPFPLELAAFFVKSFCPPNGVVCDPFSGSGTTCHASIDNGRRFVGVDIRLSQVELCRRRMRNVTPCLFADDG